MSPHGDRKNALVVLGMHRSGTSAITRALSLLGADLPGHVMAPAARNNETGFWEPLDIVQIHDELLRSAGSSWHDVSPFPRAWFNTPAARAYRDRLVEALRDNYREASMPVVKDPRICRFVPLWLDVLEHFDARPLFVLPVRNPLEIAVSLKKRDGFQVAKSALLWLRHAVDAERDTRGHARAFCLYDDLLHDWRKVADRIADDLSISWPRASHRATAEIEQFLSESLRHTTHDRGDLHAHSQVCRWVEDAYEALLAASQGDQHTLDATLDQIRQELDQADDAYGPLVADADARAELALAGRDQAVALAGRDRDDRERHIASLESSVASLEAALSDRDHRVASMEAALADRDQRIASFGPVLADRDRRVASLEANVADRDRRVASLEANVSDRDHRVASMEAALADRDQQIARLSDLARDLEARAESLAANLSDRDRLLALSNARVSAAEHEAESLRSSLADREHAAAALTGQLDQARLRSAWLDSEVASRDARIDALWADAHAKDQALISLQALSSSPRPGLLHRAARRLRHPA